MPLNKDVIAQWRDDLVDPECPKFNLDFEGIERAGRLEGDPGLFLAYRHAPSDDIMGFIGDSRTHEIIHKLTGIPIWDAYELINPALLYKRNVEIRKVSAKQFLRVLDNYLATTKVDWAVYNKEPTCPSQAAA